MTCRSRSGARLLRWRAYLLTNWLDELTECSRSVPLALHEAAEGNEADERDDHAKQHTPKECADDAGDDECTTETNACTSCCAGHYDLDSEGRSARYPRGGRANRSASNFCDDRLACVFVCTRHHMVRERVVLVA